MWRFDSLNIIIKGLISFYFHSALASEAPITWEENCFLPLGYITLIQVQRTITPTTASIPNHVQRRKVGREQKRFLLTRLSLSSRNLFIPVDALPLPFLLVHLTHQGWVTLPSSRLIPCPESFCHNSFVQTRCIHGFWECGCQNLITVFVSYEERGLATNSIRTKIYNEYGHWQKPSSRPWLWWLSSDLQGTGFSGLADSVAVTAPRLKQLEGERVLLVHSSWWEGQDDRSLKQLVTWHQQQSSREYESFVQFTSPFWYSPESQPKKRCYLW